MKKINKTVIINPGKNKFTFMNKKLVFQILLLISLLTVFAYFVNNKQSGEVIVVGTGNPGKIFVYDYNSFQRKEIDTGFKLVHTVRIGDAFNDGKNVIVAGVSNSFYGPPYGCEVILLDPSNNFKESLVDNVGDLRCKDLTIGDADNDGRNEIVLGTHGEGTINIYKWDGKWKKQEVEKNFIKQVDEKEGVNHRVPVEKLTYDTVEQSAVHIVKIGDIDNDGRNEIVATISSPLEHTDGPPISFVNVYEFDGKNWNRTTIHRGTGFQHRSILIDDFDYSGWNEVLIGAAPNRLFMLRYDGNWSSALIFNQTIDKNMKGLDFQDIYSNGKKVIVLATGIPNTLIYTLEWDGREFQKKLIGNVSQVLENYNVIKNLNYNALDVQARDIDNDGKLEIIVAGEADTSVTLDKLTPQNNIFGWEATPYGFLVVYKFDEKNWNPTVLDTYSVLGMDIGNIRY